jgi:uncharacterized protein YndB with AHSA1/START domain
MAASNAKGNAAVRAAREDSKSSADETVFVAEPGKPTLVITRAFEAPRRLVFEAWTKPEHLRQWMLGPSGWTMPVCEGDLRPGGRWHRVWRHASGEEMEMRGEYREIVPPEKVVSTESWGGDWPATLNTLVLSEKGGQTTATLTLLYPSVAARDAALKTGMEEGVSQSFDRLAQLVATRTRTAPDFLITRVLHAPRELVFQAWTTPEHMTRWFGPRGFTLPECEIEFRAGGGFRFVLRGPDGKDYPFDGQYVEIAEPERIVFRGTIHDAPGHEIRTTVTFADHEGKTRLTVHQSYNFESDATRGAPEGWAQTLDHLTAYLAKA